LTTNVSAGSTHSFLRTRDACDSRVRVRPSKR
jgi:hypothetical protein